MEPLSFTTTRKSYLPFAEPSPSQWHQMLSDLLVPIFQQLAVLDLFRCARVCKRWRTLAIKPILWKRHEAEILQQNLKRKACKTIEFAVDKFTNPSVNISTNYIYFRPTANDLWVYNRQTSDLVKKLRNGRFDIHEDLVVETGYFTKACQHRKYMMCHTMGKESFRSRCDLVHTETQHLAVWNDGIVFAIIMNGIFRFNIKDEKALLCFWAIKDAHYEHIEIKSHFLIIYRYIDDKKCYTIFDLNNNLQPLIADMDALNLVIINLEGKDVLCLKIIPDVTFGIFNFGKFCTWYDFGTFNHDKISNMFYEYKNNRLEMVTLKFKGDQIRAKYQTYAFEKAFEQIASVEKVEKWGSFLLMSNLKDSEENSAPWSGIWEIANEVLPHNWLRLKLVFLVCMQRTHLHEVVFYSFGTNEESQNTLKAYDFVSTPVQKPTRPTKSECVIL